jgi:predicted AlkP superfamily pyrophosphatase or phosphodiesterase
VAIVVVIGWALALSAFLILRDGDKPTVVLEPSQSAMAANIGSDVMQHLERGHVPDVSAEITLVPRPHRYVAGNWDPEELAGPPDTFTSHPNPWRYLAHIPLILYGPGYIPVGTENQEVVDLADLAPTYAAILGMTGLEADGEPLPEIEAPASNQPKAIFTIVLDGGGWNLLDEYPTAWPAIKRLAERGTSYTNATTGSAPSLTGALHPTLGTGFYPKNHGVPTNPAWAVNALRVAAVSELWDEQNDNAAVVAATAFHTTHLGMIGHGLGREGGDQDVAVLWKLESFEWFTPEAYFLLPDYLSKADLETLAAYEEELDERDGKEDELWFGNSIEEIREPIVRPATPAFVRFSADATLEVLANEGVGRDEITDFMWVEMKMPDYAGHEWNMLRPEVEDVLRETDRQVERFKRALDEAVGKGNYILAITADHGQQPLADTAGGWRINAAELERDLVIRFGNVIDAVTTFEVDLDPGGLEELGVDAEEITAFLGDYTIADNLPAKSEGLDLVPDGRLKERLFAGAFTTGFLSDLSPARIRSFGDGIYAEGDLTLD